MATPHAVRFTSRVARSISACSVSPDCRVHSLPELNAELVFEPDEWRAAFIRNKKPIPKNTPALNEVIRLIARRGGFLGRKGDGEPGARTLWLGLQEIAIFVEGARYAREFSEAGTYV